MKTGKIEEIRIEEIEEMETDTMSKLEKVFDTPNKKAFIGFLTAGDPDADSTVKFILEMEKAGADLIEIGIPFSDPTAEGVVIQEANIRSLSSGMTTDGVFEIVKRVREQSEIPLAFMTYSITDMRNFLPSVRNWVSAPLLFPMCLMKRRRRWRLPPKLMA